jgi:hypothetical protein
MLYLVRGYGLLLGLTLSFLIVNAINNVSTDDVQAQLIPLCTSLKMIMPGQRRSVCSKPQCKNSSWSQVTNVSSRLIILSYGHNGFGNQVFSHQLGYSLAQHLQASLYIDTVTLNLAWGEYPPNTMEGAAIMDRLIPDENKLYLLNDDNSTIRKLCENEEFFISDRRRNLRDRKYTETFLEKMSAILLDDKPRCLKLVGFFQDGPMCLQSAKDLWNPRLDLIGNESLRNIFHAQDISVYLRCALGHYHTHGPNYYDTILNHTSYNEVLHSYALNATKII